MLSMVGSVRSIRGCGGFRTYMVFMGYGGAACTFIATAPCTVLREVLFDWSFLRPSTAGVMEVGRAEK